MTDHYEENAARVSFPVAEDRPVTPAPKPSHEAQGDAPPPWEIPRVVLKRGDHAELADLLLRVVRQRYERVVATSGRLYGYRAGVFEPVDESELKRIVKQFAGIVEVEGAKEEPRPLHVSTGSARGATEFALAEVHDAAFFEGAANGVGFTDGFVRVAAHSLELVPHSPAHRARHAYAFAFDGNSEPAAFIAFLNDVFRDDVDRDDKIAAVQEFMGAAIAGMAPRYERALMLLGPGSNGKTRLTEIIAAAMPPGAAISLPPSLWHDQYQRPLLDGARFNCVPDLMDDELGPAVKGVISGEGVSARSPGHAATTFKPVAAHAFGCNTLPSTKDRSAGFWRRWLILTMNRSFQRDPQRDVSVHKRIIATDLPAIVRWALKGAARLAARADYTIPPSSVVAIERWRGSNDVVRLFVEKRTRPAVGDERGTSATELYDAFQAWASAYGAERTVTAFGIELNTMGLQGKRGRSGVRYAVVLLPRGVGS